MRTSIDIPDELFRRTKVAAASRGTTLKAVVIEALERELNGSGTTSKPTHGAKPPYFHLRSRRKLDLTGFDFDDLLP
jgi:hypothetical protein